MSDNKKIAIEIDGKKIECTPMLIPICERILFFGDVSLLSNQIDDVEPNGLYYDILNNKYYHKLFDSDSITFNILDNLKNNSVKDHFTILEVDFYMEAPSNLIGSLKKNNVLVLDNSNYKTFNIKDLKDKDICFHHPDIHKIHYPHKANKIQYDYIGIIEDK